jgi:hypothetical protein
MAYGPYQVDVNIASGASTSSDVDLKYQRGNIYVYVSTMSTAAALTVQDSPNSGATFYNKFVMANSSTTQANPVIIGSALGTNGGVVRLEGGGRYLRFLASAVVSGGVGFKVMAYD